MQSKRLVYGCAFVFGLLLASVFALTAVAAAPAVVSPDAPTGDLTVCPLSAGACDYTTLQAAVDAAAEGALIKVASGVYTDIHARPAPAAYTGPAVVTQVLYISKTVFVQGGYNAADGLAGAPDPEVYLTILDAGGLGRALFVAGPDGEGLSITPTIAGLRFTGGDATGLGGDTDRVGPADVGGGVYGLKANPTLSRTSLFSNTAGRGGGLFLGDSASRLYASTIMSNTADDCGGGLYLEDSPAVLEGNTIAGNSAQRGGGVCLADSDNAWLKANHLFANVAQQGGGGYFWESEAVIEDNRVVTNTAQSQGGGLYLDGSDALLKGNTFSGNLADTAAGLYLVDSLARLSANTVTANKATHNAGGVYLENSDDAQLSANTIAANISQLGHGGGLYLLDSAAYLSANTISNNRTDLDGAGLYLLTSNARLSANTITANSSQQGSGGGLYASASDITSDHDVIRANSAYLNGGGVYLQNNRPMLTNDLIADNQVEVIGSGLYILGALPHLLHTTIARNGGGDGSGLYITRDSAHGIDSVALLTNTILVKHSVGVFATAGNTAGLHATLWGSGDWANSADSGGSGVVQTGVVNVRGNPAFVNPAAGDYHIGGASAARDGGVAAGVSQDMDGQPRPMDAHEDIGADEYAGVGLAIAQQPPDTFVNRGQSFVYTLLVTNVGTVGANGLVLTDMLDRWQMPLSAQASRGNCSIIASGWGGTVRCQTGALASNAAVRVTLTTLVSEAVELGQTMTATLAVTSNETARSIDARVSVHDCHVRLNESPDEYTTPQAAVEAAGPGALIQLAGVCLGVGQRGALRQLIYLDKPLTLRGGYTTSNWLVSDPVAHPTRLDAQGQGRVVYATANARLEGLELVGGNALGLRGGADRWDGGGGLYVANAAMVLSHTRVFSNGAKWGGGVYLEDSPAVLEANTWVSNTARQAGGGLYLADSDATLRANRLYTNTAADYGAGLYLADSAATLRANTCVSNMTPHRGGGLYLYQSPAVLDANVVSANFAGELGGGVFLYQSAAVLDANQIISNVTSQDGGGLYVQDSPARLTSNTVLSNTGGNFGGGLYIKDSPLAVLSRNTIVANRANSGGGLHMENSAAAFQGNRISANIAQVAGGGVYLFLSPARLDGNVITANSARDGAGAYLQYSHAELVNTVVADNRASGAGGGLYLTASSPRLLHTTLARNTSGGASPAAGSGLYVTNYLSVYSAPTLTNTILVAHNVGVSVTTGNTATLQATLWGSGAWANQVKWGGGGVVSASLGAVEEYPGFVAPDQGDYHISAFSAAVDAGQPLAGQSDAAKHDLDGDPRSDGRPDLGADELPGGLQIAKQAEPEVVRPGEVVSYTILVVNASGLALRATITDILPLGITTGATPAGTAFAPGGTIVWSDIPIAPGGEWTTTFTVTAATNYAGTLVNVVEISSWQGLSGVYTETSQVWVEPPNRAPYTPRQPNPANAAVNVPVNPVLTWRGGDPDGDVVTYTLSLGVLDLPPVVASGLTAARYTPTQLLPETTYYWAILATDGLSQTAGPVWHFTTQARQAVYLPMVLRQSR